MQISIAIIKDAINQEEDNKTGRWTEVCRVQGLSILC
jgi:hypothetical protein